MARTKWVVDNGTLVEVPVSKKKILVGNLPKDETYLIRSVVHFLDENEVMLEVLADCIDYVYDKENMYYAKDSTKEELEEFIDNLNFN
jgi:hypothetical protein